MSSLIPIEGITELQLSVCHSPSTEEPDHVGHFGLFNDDSMPLCLGYYTAQGEWMPDQMKTGYAQAMWQMRTEYERRQHAQHTPPGIPEGAQAIEVTPEMSKKILEMLRDGGPSTPSAKPHEGYGGYL